MGVVVVGRAGLAAAIVERFRASSRIVTLLDDPDLLDDPIATADALAAAARIEPIDQVVFANLDESSFVQRTIAEHTEASWDAACERSMRQAFVLLQQAHAALGDGSSVVLVLPSVASVGVAELVPLCTAIEGIRVMAKSLARRWGARSITVNTIEVDLATFLLADHDDDAESRFVPVVPVLGAPALPAGSIVDDVMGLLEFFVSPAGHAVTGALLVADRGTVMLP